MEYVRITGKESPQELAAFLSVAAPDELYLTRQALLVFIDRFLESALSARDLERIAEMFDASEFARFEESLERPVARALFRLSTPEINDPLTFSSVADIRKELLQSREGQ